MQLKQRNAAGIFQILETEIRFRSLVQTNISSGLRIATEKGGKILPQNSHRDRNLVLVSNWDEKFGLYFGLC